jgi:hypothetical protein
MRTIAFVLLLIPISVFSQVQQLTSGVWTPEITSVVVCDTKEQVASVITAHRTGGAVAGQARLSQLQQTPGSGGAACGMVQGFIFISQVYWEGEIDDSKASLVEIMMVMPDGRAHDQPLYSALFNTQIVAKDEANMTAI